jgi:superfamily II DNA or RNA helicase
MPTAYSSQDLGRIFDGRVLTRGRSLMLIGAVKVALTGDTIRAVVDDKGVRQEALATPAPLGSRVVFDTSCTCGAHDCAHLAAGLLGALDRFPELRAVVAQPSLLDRVTAPAAATTAEKRRLLIELAPAIEGPGLTIGFVSVGEVSRNRERLSPHAILTDPNRSAPLRALASLLAEGADDPKALDVPIEPGQASQVLVQAVRTNIAIWKPTGKVLSLGRDRSYPDNKPPPLPAKSAVLKTPGGIWYIDGAMNTVGLIRSHAPHAERVAKGGRPRAGDRRAAGLAPDISRAIVERTMTPVLRLGRLECPDENGRPRPTDTLDLCFDYGAPGRPLIVGFDDERQFLRVEGSAGAGFIRRDLEAEAAALDQLRQDGFMQMRIEAEGPARGRRVFTYRGRDASEGWVRFVSERLPALRELGWRDEVATDFGPRQVEKLGAWDMKIGDGVGGYSLEPGIEVDGVRVKLLPILTRLLEQGGIDSARIVQDQVITSLEDGRVVRLPADRVRQLLAVMGDLLGAAKRVSGDALILPPTEAAAVLDLEEILSARFDDRAAIRSQIERFRADATYPHATLPPGFKAILRPYQQHGVDWMQALRTEGLSGLLADDMGLGKTAQTIAHICVEHEEGRLSDPALVVVPTSLVPNWIAELTRFAPHLRILVLHGIDRHERRAQQSEADVVITTYTVLARDIEQMKEQRFHLLVLDEAQAIKSPYAKATLAVCQINANQRLCLSGTPIENNLGELWSQFAFLMPGLLGGRRDFAKRYRLPIERRADEVRRSQLARRIRPFMLRRTKAEVVPELPPKHTILRRVTLAPDQRELYETIRATQHESVREHIAASGLAQSRIAVLDALLKLRQACCDPRLVKLDAARAVTSSSKLDDLAEMVSEMVSEGRRILIFSQFTSMLDLIEPRLHAAKIAFASLRGDTRDRAAPVQTFESGQVPVFLISLKAGGRGLNLTSADTVIHYDPWWNPAVEDQASDRAHRIGQTKSVFVFKLIAADTVEERILDLQARKAELASLAFDSEQDMSKLGFEDIDYLLGGDAAAQDAAA